MLSVSLNKTFPSFLRSFTLNCRCTLSLSLSNAAARAIACRSTIKHVSFSLRSFMHVFCMARSSARMRLFSISSFCSFFCMLAISCSLSSRYRSKSFLICSASGFSKSNERADRRLPPVRIETNKVKKECYLMEGRKEGNVLFNDALNTFYLRLYGVRHMVKDHSDSVRKPAASTKATLSD